MKLAGWENRRATQINQLTVNEFRLKQKQLGFLVLTLVITKSLKKKMNFYNLTMDCRNVLNLWKQRWLSLAGKIQIFKSLIASKPVYIATMKVLPKNTLDDLQRMHKEIQKSQKLSIPR